MANILTAPLSGNIYFDDGSQDTTIPDLTGSAVALGFDGCAGLTVTSYNTTSGDRFTVAGESGSLFSVNDSLTGTVFSVNDASGLPIIEVNSDEVTDTVAIGEFGTNALFVSAGNVGVGTNTPTSPLHVCGNIAVTGTVDGRDIASDGSKLDGICPGAGVGTVTSVTAGTGMTQSGSSTVNPTLNVIGGTGITANANDIALSPAGPGAGTYGNTGNACKIDTITLDAYGRVTAVACGATGSGNGTVTSVGITPGTGLDVSGSPITSSGNITVNLDLTEVTMGAGLDSTATGITLDLSELTDGTAAIVPTTDEVIYLDAGTQKRKLFSEIFGSNAYNSTAFTTCCGTVTSVTAGAGMTQTGTSTVNPTLNVIGDSSITVSADSLGVASACNTKWDQSGCPGICCCGDITQVVAGTNLTGGGTAGCVTINMATGGAGSGTYGSTADNCKIDTITLDAYGRVTAVACGPTGDIAGVTAGSGMTGGGTSGTPTLNVIGGDGITANADNITVDSTVARTNVNETFSCDVTINGDLTVNGDITCLETIVSTTSALSVVNHGSGPAITVNQAGSNDIVDFRDDNSSVFYIENGGFVGINDTNPGHRLDVNGNINATGSYKLDDGDVINSGKCFVGAQVRPTTDIADAYIASAATWNAKTTCLGTVTGVTAGNAGIDIGGSATAPSVCLDLSELTTSTTNGDGDYFAVIDTANVQRKLTKANINISGFNNDSGFTTCTGTGDITAVTAGNGLTGGATSGAATLNVGAGTAITVAADTVGVTSACNTAWNAKTTCTGTVDTSGTPVDNDFAKFTDANTIEGRSCSEVRSDLGIGTIASCAVGCFLTITGKAADSNLLDGIDSSAFLRSNTADTASGTINFSGDICVGDQIFHTGDSDTYLQFVGANDFRVVAGARDNLRVKQTEVVINQASNDVDFHVFGNNDDYALFVDGATDKVGIGLSAPGEKLTVSGNLSASGTGFVDKLGIGAEPSGDEVLTVDGTNGNLFTITDSVTGTVFAVSDSAGLPILEAYTDACDMITMGEYGSNALVVCDTKVGVGTATPNEALTVVGSVSATCFKKAGGTSSQFLKADGSVDSNSYTTCTGDITCVGAGNGLTGGGTSGNVALNVGAGTAITVAADTVGVSTACNTAWNAKTTCTGTVTSIATGNGISGGTITGSGTLTVGAGTGLTQTSTGLCINSTCNSTWNAKTTCTGTVTSIATGNGISGGTITGSGTLTVGAGTGLTQTSTGLCVNSTCNTTWNSAYTTTKALSGCTGLACTGDITQVVAGTNLTGGGTSGCVTVNMATGGVGSGTYGSTANGTKIDTITVDAYGRVTAVATGVTGDINGVTAGTGMTGGGTSGTPTLNVIGGDGITANADNITVDSTVARTNVNETFSCDVTINGDLTVNGDIVCLETIVSTTSALSVVNHGSGPAITVNQAGSNDIVDFRDDNSSVFYIENGGFVGINDTNPGHRLDVNGNINATGSYKLDDSDVINSGKCFVGAQVRPTTDIADAYIASAATWNAKTTCTGTVTSIATGNGISGGTITGSGTLTVAAGTGLTQTSTGLCVNSTCNTTWNSAYTTTKALSSCAGLTCVGDITAVVAGTDLTGGATSGSATLNVNSATASTANTVVKRDGSGDINVRLLRSEYDSTNSSIGYIMTQVDTATNNYVRPSTMAQVRACLNVANGSTSCTGTVTSIATGNGISGGTITGSGTLTVGAGTGLTQTSTGLCINSTCNSTWNAKTTCTGTVTSVGGGDGLTGTVTTSGNLAVDSTVVRTAGNQCISGLKCFASGITTGEVRTYNAQHLVLNAGESSSYATGQTNEFVYANAEGGLQINSSPDNWASGWAGRKTTTINDTNGDSTFSRNIIVGGTVDGRDVAADGTKLDSIACGATACTGDITQVVAGTNLTGGGTSGCVTVNMATGGVGAGTYGNTGNGCKIDTITVDAYGRVTAVACGPTGSTSCIGTVTSIATGNGISGGTITGSGTLTVGAGTGLTQTSTGLCVNTTCNTTWNSAYTTTKALSSCAGLTCVGDITAVTAGTNLTGGGTSGSVTINMATGGVGSGTYGSTADGTKIDTITVDAYGRVTAVATGATGSTSCTGNLCGCLAQCIYDSNNNFCIGANAGEDLTTGLANVMIGKCAGRCITTGGYNVNIGCRAGEKNTTKYYNTFIGFQTGFCGGGCGNQAIGQQAMQNSTASNSVAIGKCTLYSATGNSNTAIGAQALQSVTSGQSNFGLGPIAGFAMATGSDNVFIGSQAARYMTSGSNNIAIGKYAGRCHASGTKTSGDNNIYIGPDARAGAANSTNEMVFGYVAQGCGSNTIRMGNTSITAAYIQTSWNTCSDARDKTCIADLDKGLCFIGDLQPKSYMWRCSRDSEETKGKCAYGFLAQDILALEDEGIIVDDNNPEHLSMKNDYLIPILVKGMQDQQKIIESLEKRIELLEA